MMGLWQQRWQWCNPTAVMTQWHGDCGKNDEALATQLGSQ